MMHEDGVRAMMLTLRANPTVKPPTPSPVTRGLVSTPNVPRREKPPSVYIAMAADFEANLQTCSGVSAQCSMISQQLVRDVARPMQAPYLFSGAVGVQRCCGNSAYIAGLCQSNADDSQQCV